MPKALRTFCFAVAGFLALAVVIVHVNKTSAANATVPAQDVLSLDRRISTLEQRLYVMESNLNRLQQEVQYAQRQPTPSSARDPEIDRLRLEVNLWQSRLSEIECGLVKLDERTLPATARPPRSKPADPCRLQPNTPVQLSGHPQ